MSDTNIPNILKGMLAFTIVTFAVQASSHFVINTEHFASIIFMRKEPIIALGVGVMLLQGAILTFFYLVWSKQYSGKINAVLYGLLMGVFFVSYLAIVEPSKYTVSSIAEWALVEGIAGLVQFTLFGILLGMMFTGNGKHLNG